MKRRIWMSMVAAVGSAALAQQTPGAGAPPAGSAPAVAALPPANSAAATNAASGVADLSKAQAIFAEIGSLNKELLPREKELQASDPDLKALMDKKTAARQLISDLETQRRELVDQKLSADPKLAPLVAKRQELQQTLKAMRPVTPSGVSPLGNGPRRMPPRGGAEPAQMEVVPKVVPVPAPVPAPEADKPGNPLK